MARRKQLTQQSRRRKAYAPVTTAAASSIKPKGAFRLFGNYRLFAIIGAVVLFGGYAVSVASGGRASAHGGGGGGGHSQSSVRGEGVKRAAATEADGAIAPAPRATKQYVAPPALTVDPEKRYLAVIETERGTVQVELLPRDAPQAVNNFHFSRARWLL